jgi:PQQ enzyme repeat
MILCGCRGELDRGTFSSCAASTGGQPEVVGEGSVFIGSQDGGVQAIEASNGKLLWRYMIQELAVQMPAVYGAYVNFSASTSYQQALAIVTGLGLKTFADCHPYWWTKGDDKDIYPGLHLLTVTATINSAPLWLDRLKATPGVERAEASGPHSCPEIGLGSGFRYLPDGQAGTFVRVTFADTAKYATTLDTVNALGFRLADPCYEQARARGTKPTWHSMGQADSLGKMHTLVLATTLYNATDWANQLGEVAGVVKVEAPFKMVC